MKKICLISLISVLIISCKTRIVSNEEDHDDLYLDNVQKIEATVEKIDSIKKARRYVCYIIYIKNDSMKAVFAIAKYCKFKPEYEDKIKEGGTYRFELLKYGAYNGVEDEITYEEQWVNNKMIWNSKMDRLFFDECMNMCGLYIKQ